MNTITNFLISPNSSYDYTNKNGEKSQVNGVDKGFGHMYCLENDTMKQMMGNMQDATLLSAEACAGKIADAEGGKLPAFDQWGLDLPAEKKSQSGLQSARDNLGSSPSVASMKPKK